MLIHKRYTLLLPIIFYGIGVLVCYLKVQNYIGGDTISYLAITEKIVDGRFYDSINAYWSPLISWILVPFLFIIKNGILSFQLLNCIIGAFIVYRLCDITKMYIKNSLLYIITVSGSSLLVGSWCISTLTADILFLGVLVQYYHLLSLKKIYNSVKNFVLIGTLLYFAKAYGFYFFLFHSLIYGFYYHFKVQKISLENIFKSYLVYFLVIGIWCYIIYTKYNFFTLSTASIYNTKIITSDGTLLHPGDTVGLIVPHKEYAYTAWEEMYQHTAPMLKNISKKNITSSFIIQNFKNQFAFYNKTTRYGAFIFCLGFLTLLVLKKLVVNIILPLSLFLIFTAGFLLLFINDRYLYFAIVVLLLINAWFFDQIIEQNKYFKFILTLFLVYTIIRGWYDDQARLNITVEKISYKIAKQLSIEKNISYASFNAYQFSSIAYFNKWKNFGGTVGYKNDSIQLANNLTLHKIKYLIYPNNVKLPKNIDTIYFNVRLKDIGDFVVYKKN